MNWAAVGWGGGVGLLAGAGAGAAVAGAIVAGVFGFVNKAIDPDPKMTEMAIGILQAAPSAATSNLRLWAIDVINERAKPKLQEVHKDELKKNALPKPPPPSPQR